MNGFMINSLIKNQTTLAQHYISYPNTFSSNHYILYLSMQIPCNCKEGLAEQDAKQARILMFAVTVILADVSIIARLSRSIGVEKSSLDLRDDIG